MARRREPGQLEQELLAVVAGAGHPLTPGEVLTEFGQPLAYTTVMSTLSRLADKGVLVRETAGRGYAYSLAVAREHVEAAMTARQMTRLLDAGTDRAAALARFVADLRPEDEALLARLLAEPVADRSGER
jgi:predicted transcriptional regulator